MGFIENAFHPDRKRQENWRRFSTEAGGFFVSEGTSGCDEVHIPFMGRQIQVRMQSEGRRSRTVLTLGYPNDDLQFKIFGWGGHNVPVMDRDPYLNSEFPDLAPRAKVEFSNTKKLTKLLADVDLRRSISESASVFTLEAEPDSICLDNRAYGSRNDGVIEDVAQLHAALEIMKRLSKALDAIESATAQDDSEGY